MVFDFAPKNQQNIHTPGHSCYQQMYNKHVIDVTFGKDLTLFSMELLVYQNDKFQLTHKDINALWTFYLFVSELVLKSYICLEIL